MGRKLLLEHVNVPGIETLEVYRKWRLFSCRKALKTMAPDDITEEVKNLD